MPASRTAAALLHTGLRHDAVTAPFVIDCEMTTSLSNTFDNACCPPCHAATNQMFPVLEPAETGSTGRVRCAYRSNLRVADIIGYRTAPLI